MKWKAVGSQCGLFRWLMLVFGIVFLGFLFSPPAFSTSPYHSKHHHRHLKHLKPCKFKHGFSHFTEDCPLAHKGKGHCLVCAKRGFYFDFEPGQLT
ncbi:MAG: hypothetical protein HYU64_17520 [Armatimonadetes bacterium]|nr:hypothetical protein [Armatimonadota bacterium]